MRRGWRRAEAESIVGLIACVLAAKHAEHVRPEQMRDLAGRAAHALQREPVLAGAVLSVAPLPGARQALLRLLQSAPDGPHPGMARLAYAAIAFELLNDAVDEHEEGDDEDLDGEAFEDELPA